MSKMLEVARKYLAAGFSIIPLGLDKRPYNLMKWEEYQFSPPTEKQIENWWKIWPDAQIGIVTGKVSGVSVVDVDAKSGGLETIKTLHLPITWTVKTGGGGWHYYYAYNEKAPQGSNFYQGIDVRNDGGYVVAPPSLHKSGKRYEWTFKEDEKSEFPIELFDTKEVKKTDWASVLELGTKEGGRNDTATKLVGKLFTLFQPNTWEETVWKLLQAWNDKNVPPLPKDELRAVYESIARKAVNDVRVEKDEESFDYISSADLVSGIENKLNEEKVFFTWGNSGIDERSPLLERGLFAILFGQFSSGKTTFAMYMARQNAEQKKNVCFITLEMSKEKLVRNYAFNRANIGKELYKSGNYDKSVIGKFSKELEQIHLVGLGENAKKREYSTEDIEKIIIEKRPQIVFIDNLNKIKGEGRNELEISAFVSNQLLAMTRKHNVAIVLIHHSNKPPQVKMKGGGDLRGISGLRGTNKLNDDADIVCEIGRPKTDIPILAEQNKSIFAVYKDRDFDQRCTLNLFFKDASFYEENDYLRMGNEVPIEF